MNNSFYCKNKNAQNDFYNNNYYYKKNISIIKKNNNNKIIRIRNNCSIQQHQNLINNKSISPKRKNISILPFKKIIVKNTKNPPKIEKITYDKIIRIPKKIINDVNYLDKNNIIINNKTNNIVYIKQISPIRNPNSGRNKIYENNTNYINKHNQNNK